MTLNNLRISLRFPCLGLSSTRVPVSIDLVTLGSSAQAFDVSGVSEYTVASNMVRNCTFYIEIRSIESILRISLWKIRFLTIFETAVYSETPGTSNACDRQCGGSVSDDIFFWLKLIMQGYLIRWVKSPTVSWA